MTKNVFFKASGIIFFGSLIGNFLNYVFNLAMGWLLPPIVYGELVALTTLLLIVSVPAGTFTLVVAKYIAEHWARDEKPAMASLFRAATRLSFLAGAAGFLLIVLAAPAIASYLKVAEVPVLIFGLLIPISFMSGASSGFLQGIQSFVPLSVNAALGSILKLAFAIALVYAGYSLSGIMVAIVLASLLTYAYNLSYARRAMRNIKEEAQLALGELFRDKKQFILITFLATFFSTIFLNVDILMAKHYLLPAAAGQYAALSVLGKIITYGSGAILTVLFPLVTASHARGDVKQQEKYLFASLGIVGGISFLLVIAFSAFPTLVLHLLFGSRYLEVAQYLPFFAAAAGFSSLSAVFVQFFLAVHDGIFLYPLVFFSVAEFAGIFAFHADLSQIVFSSLATSILLAGSCFAIYAIRKARFLTSGIETKRT
jgi:O-antigen/teichoic acid export membrane protein